jgi:hypothetical protein
MLSALRFFHSKSILYGILYGRTRHYLNSQKRRFSARAERSAAVAVTVTFEAGTTGLGLQWVARECPYLVLKERAHLAKETPDCPTSIDDCIAKCAWFDIELGQGNWVANATATITGRTVKISAPAHDERACGLLEAGAAPTGVRYLYGDWPVATLYNKVDDYAERFPALPFVLEL